MAIRKNGIMVKCPNPECESINILVVEILKEGGEIKECQDCGKRF